MERAAEFKSEYFEGQVYAMAGGTYPHATIIFNVGRELGQALKQKPCTVNGLIEAVSLLLNGHLPLSSRSA